MHLSFVFHILGIVLWLGGLFILSRLMILHTREAPAVRPRFSYLEGRINLVAIIGAPLAILSGLYQLWLWPVGGFRSARWMHHKLTLVLLLVVIHVVLTVKQRQWARGPAEAPLGRGLLVAIHSGIGLLLIGILCLVYLTTPHFLHVG